MPLPSPVAEPPRARGAIPALGRGLRALAALAEAGREGLGFSDLQRALGGLPAPTLSRLLKALAADGYVEKTPAGVYAGGRALAALGRALGGARSLEEFALEAMTEYTRETGESIAFARFFGERLVLVEKVEVADSFKLAPRGQVFRPAEDEGPAIVVAAHLAGRDLARFTRSFESRVLDFAAFRREIVAYRQAGCRVEPMPKRPARGGPRRACVAVLDAEGRPLGELHTVVPGARFAHDRAHILERILAARDRIERGLRAAK